MAANNETPIQKQIIDLSIIITNDVLLFSNNPKLLDEISNSSAILVSGFGPGMQNTDIHILGAELGALLHNKNSLGSTTLKKSVDGDGASNNLKDFSDIPKIFEGSVSDNPFRHAIDADVHISVNDYKSAVVFAPSYYMPKVQMLFELISDESDVNYSLYFVSLSMSESASGWDLFKLATVQFNGYVYLKLYFLLNQYFKLFGFGKVAHQYF